MCKFPILLLVSLVRKLEKMIKMMITKMMKMLKTMKMTKMSYMMVKGMKMMKTKTKMKGWMVCDVLPVMAPIFLRFLFVIAKLGKMPPAIAQCIEHQSSPADKFPGSPLTSPSPIFNESVTPTFKLHSFNLSALLWSSCQVRSTNSHWQGPPSGSN